MNPDAEMVPLPKSIQAGDTTYFVDAVLRQLDREVADGCGLAIPQKNMRRMVENLFRRIAELVRARDESVSLITAERERMDKRIAELERDCFDKAHELAAGERERAELERADEVHWKTRRSLLRDLAAKDERIAELEGCNELLRESNDSLREDLAAAREALQGLLCHMRLHNEPTVSDCFLRSHGDQLRLAAVQEDAKENAIRAARAYLDAARNAGKQP